LVVLSRRDFLPVFALSVACSNVRGQQPSSSMFANGEAYDRFMGRWSSLLAPRLVEFADVAGARQVLDIGSGTGSLAFAIAQHNEHCTVVGIDPSKEYVAYAKSRNRFGQRVNFEAGDAQHLRFENSSFDCCLSLLVFNFIPDREQALREAARVARPGGRIAAAVWDYGSGMRMLRVFFDAAVKVDPEAEAIDEKHMPLSRRGELAELWKKAGLAEVDEQPLEITMRFKSFADYWEPFRLGQGPSGAYVRRQPPARLDQLREELKRRLSLASENVAFELPARAWAVRGAVGGGG
jgi:ubiquinone/menaquinone biosynthesis C-methylase UbiE